jgi:hypothetical protein
MRLRSTFLFLVALTASAGACAGQSEGEVCDPDAGSDDCQAPLVCTPIPARPGTTPSFGYSRCCPPMGTPAKTNVCLPFNAGAQNANLPVPTSDASPGDAAPEGSSDAPAGETSAEGGPDANPDGSSDAMGEAAADTALEAAE